MRDEIQRILQMVEDGRLTRDQATEMIAALTTAAGTAGPSASAGETAAGQAGSEEASADRTDREGGPEAESRGHRRSRHGARRRHRGHRRHRLDDDKLYDEIERAVSAGTRALRDVMSSTSLFGARGWHDDSNNSTLSKAEPPEGADFRCRDNRFAVSNLRGLRLNRAEFCGNELNAAAAADLDVGDGTFNDNAVSGSSLKHVLVDHGDVSANHFNGAQVSRLTVTRGKLTNSRFQGAQIRDVTLTDAGVDSIRLDGVRLKSVAFSAETHLSDVKLTGVSGTDWAFEDSQLSEVVLSGWRIDGFTLKRVGLERCKFKNDYVVQYGRGRHRGGNLPQMRDLNMSRTVLKNCEFINCTFDSTIIRNCNVENLCFDNVDFTDMTLTSSDALAAMARRADVA